MTEHMELITTIVNNYIPNVLQTLENYVVKGGKASDYYITHYKGKKIIRFTDWDLACNSIESQEIIKNTIINYLSTYGISNIVIQRIINHDAKKGIQIGMDCGNSISYFLDIIIYEQNDPIFTNILINNNIRYININSLLTDLQETYNDRINNLSKELFEFRIMDIDINRLNDNIEFYMNKITNQLIQKYSIKTTTDIAKIKKLKTLSETDKNEDIKDVQNYLQNNIIQMYSDILPKFRLHFEKLIRTYTRLQLLQ